MKATTTVAELEQLLLVPQETPHLEFKEAKSQFSRDKLVDYCVALGNEGGGKLILGVSDVPPRCVVGTHTFPAPSDACEHVYNVLRIHIHAEEISHTDGRVLIFHLPPRPRGTAWNHDGRYLMRVGSSLVAMSPDRLQQIFAESRETFLDQIAIVRVSGEEVIQLLDTQSYFDLIELPYPAAREGVLERFQNENLISAIDGAYSITNLGAILFAKHLADFGPALARKATRTIVYKGANKLHTLRDDRGKKGYAVGFASLLRFIDTLLPSNEIIRQALRETVRLYPAIAIREIVANSLIHQDFEETGTSVVIEIYSDRIEVSNPGNPIVSTQRFIDSYQSRNEQLADLMRRLRICEEKGSGVDKVVDAVEAHQLPAPDFRQGERRTSVVLFAPIPFKQMDRADRIRACYQHCCLRYVTNQKMTNQSLRERFHIGDEQAETVSRIIRDTVDEKLVKLEDPETSSRRYARYLPFWA